MEKLLKSLKSQIIELFFPKQCVYCELYFDMYLCTECKKSLKIYEPESYLSRKPSKNWELSHGEKKNSQIYKAIYLYKYGAVIHKLITEIKYGFYKDYLNLVAELIYESKEFNKLNPDDYDLLTFVPLSSKRELWRGFNQSKEIARIIAIKWEKPFCTLLLKSKETSSQIDLNRSERILNLKGAFKIIPTLPVKLSSQRILIIDDIFTTGSTILECASTLKTKYPELEITSFCLARGD